MIRQLRAAGHKPSAFRTEDVRRRIEEAGHLPDYRDASTTTSLDMRTAMIRLNDLLPTDRTVCTDGGRCKFVTWRYLHVAEPLDFTHTVNFGSIGLAIPTAIGAAAARGDRLTVAVAGDGAAMMSMMEFTTAVRHHLPLVVVVLNDGSYGAEYRKFQLHDVDPKLSTYEWPSFADLAVAMGGHAATAHTLEDLDCVATLIAGQKWPLLIDVRADPAVDVLQGA
jgi:thiamine pyrophosphate-dependent acetolactate synthase large subunit-like protein